MNANMKPPVRAFVGLLSLVFALAAQPAGADRGVGVSTGEMTVRDVLSPGGEYTLPVIGVINTGDEPSQYTVSITYLSGQTQERPGADWFSFQPDRFTLTPGESRDVVVRIEVPAGARAGEYFALVRAQTVAEAEGRTSLGVAAATKLAFSVGSSGWIETQWRSLNRSFEDGMPWTLVVPAAAVAAFFATKARRLPFRLRMPIERR